MIPDSDPRLRSFYPVLQRRWTGEDPVSVLQQRFAITTSREWIVLTRLPPWTGYRVTDRDYAWDGHVWWEWDATCAQPNLDQWMRNVQPTQYSTIRDLPIVWGEQRGPLMIWGFHTETPDPDLQVGEFDQWFGRVAYLLGEWHRGLSSLEHAMWISALTPHVVGRTVHFLDYAPVQIPRTVHRVIWTPCVGVHWRPHLDWMSGRGCDPKMTPPQERRRMMNR